MEKKQILGIASLVSFLCIPFVPSGSNVWIYLIILGIFFGILWIKLK